MNYKNYYCIPKYSDAEKSYYGAISGDDPIGMVEAPNLEDFETLFHQKVDDYLATKKTTTSKRRTAWIIVGVVVVLLLVLLAATCPDKSQHRDVLSDRISVIFDDHAADDDGLGMFGALIGNKIIDVYLNNCLSVDNYVFISIGKLSSDGKDRTVSVGVLGHVFAPSRDKIRESIADDENIQSLLEDFF